MVALWGRFMVVTMRVFTDYPFEELGDEAFKEAPVREVEVLSYDGDKYCRVLFDGRELEVKSGYLYVSPGRFGAANRVCVSDLPNRNIRTDCDSS